MNYNGDCLNELEQDHNVISQYCIDNCHECTQINMIGTGADQGQDPTETQFAVNCHDANSLGVCSSTEVYQCGNDIPKVDHHLHSVEFADFLPTSFDPIYDVNDNSTGCSDNVDHFMWNCDYMNVQIRGGEESSPQGIDGKFDPYQGIMFCSRSRTFP